MLQVQASRHQGHPMYQGHGRQCLANSTVAVLESLQSNVKNWSTSTLDDILYKGDKLYIDILKTDTYLTVEDIPSNVAKWAESLHGSLHGVTDVPFYSLSDAMKHVFDVKSNVGCIFTMGTGHPCYSSAILKNENLYYFFDPHSRNESGMISPNGVASLTCHKNVEALCIFMKHLAASLGEKGNVPFELTRVQPPDTEFSGVDLSDNDSEFSGFDTVSEGEYSCKLFLANDKIKNVIVSDISDVSDTCSGSFGIVSDVSDTCSGSFGVETESEIDKAILNDSVTFLNSSFNEHLFESDAVQSTLISMTELGENENNGDQNHHDHAYHYGNHSDDDHNDNGHDADTEDTDDDDQAAQPLTRLLKRKKSKSGSISEQNVTVDNGCDEQCYGGGDDVVTGLLEQNSSARTDLSNDSDDENIPLARLRRQIILSGNDNSLNRVVSPTTSNDVSGLYTGSSQNTPVERNEESNVTTPCESQPQNNDSNLQTGNVNGEVRGRKRKRDPKTWKRNIAKRRRNEGQSYCNRSGNIRAGRVMKKGCGYKCRSKCKLTFSEEEREMIFHSFWKLGDIGKQRQFILRHAVRKPKVSNTKQVGRRMSSVKWSLPKQDGSPVKVCKTFFLHTLGISDKMVTTVYKKQNIAGIADDLRGKHESRPNRVNENMKEKVRAHIKSFATVESHYCRKDSKKQYLPADLSIAKMHRLYTEICQKDGIAPVLLSFYREIFNTEFNLAFHRPMKDQCDTCTNYQNASNEEKEKLNEMYTKHIQNKELARENKETDKKLAKTETDNELVVACFDLEQILLTPHSFQSCLYYKRRLKTFNFTIYDMGTGNGYSYVWNEALASRGACEIASCLYSFIGEMSLKGKKKFIFYSDNCSSQNKNRYYVTMLWYCLNKFSLTSFTHKYLEKGHTQNEGDSIHSSVEAASRNISIYSTPQWSAVIRAARPKHPYVVKEMSLTDFYDFKVLSENMKNFEQNTEKEKAYWTAFKTLKLIACNPNSFEYQTDYSGQTYNVDLFQRLRLKEIPTPLTLNLTQLRDDGIKIGKDKFADLIALCRDNIIPSMHHVFYLLLPHE